MATKAGLQQKPVAILYGKDERKLPSQEHSKEMSWEEQTKES